MVSILGLLIRVVLGFFLVAVVVVPIILFIRYKEGGHGGEGSPAAIIGIIIGVGLIGLVVLVGLVVLGAFFFKRQAMRAQMAQREAVLVKELVEARASGDAEAATQPIPQVRIEIRDAVALAAPTPVAISLALSRPQDEGAEPGHFAIEIANRTGDPLSPSSLQDAADNMAWYVEVNGKTSYDSVNWRQEEFSKEIPPGQKGVFSIQVPLKTINASSGDTIVVYYRCDQEGGSFTIRSNKLQL